VVRLTPSARYSLNRHEHAAGRPGEQAAVEAHAAAPGFRVAPRQVIESDRGRRTVAGPRAARESAAGIRPRLFAEGLLG
jgi:hypothetical protein